jgi:hypothetical protein
MKIEETLDMLRRLRALTAMSRMQKRAEERGVSGMSPAEIDKEIRAARKGRRPT